MRTSWLQSLKKGLGLRGGNDYQLVEFFSWIVTVLRYSVKKEGHRVHRQKEFADTHGRLVEPAEKKLSGNARKLLMHWSWENVTVVQGGLYDEERIEG